MNDVILDDTFILESSPREIYNTLKVAPCDIDFFYDSLSSYLKKGHLLKVENIANFFLQQPGILNDKDAKLEASMSTIISYSKHMQKDYEACINICLPIFNSNVSTRRKITLAFIVAGAYKAKKQYDKSFEYNNKIIEWLPTNNRTNEEQKILITAFFNIGNLFSLIRDLNKAETYYERGAKIINDVEDYKLKSSFESNYALIKYKNAKIPLNSALEKVEGLISYCKSSEDLHKYALANLDRIDLLIEGKRYIEAEHFLKERINFDSDFDFEISHDVARLKIYFYTKKYDQFIELLEEKIERILNEKSAKICQEILKLAVNYFWAHKEFEKYHHYSQLLISLLEKNQIKAHKKKLVQLEAGVKLGLKEQQLNWLKQLNEKEQKHNLELSKKNKELQQFASITAHDLRSPIRTINSFVSILDKEINLDSKNRELFDLIKIAGSTADSLINDLLDFARSGSYRNDAKAIDLNEIVQSVKINLTRLIHLNEAIIIIENKLPEAIGHQTAFLQLFQNLIQNAIKFKKANESPVIKISFSETEDGEIILSFLDNGRGMTKEVAEKIFNPLFRYHVDKSEDGFGLGLATCHKIVEFYGGRIVIESEVDKGSCFKVMLPKKVSFLK